MKRVRVRRERPTALALAVALCVTMLAVYTLTLNAVTPGAVESMAAAPRVTRELKLEPLEGWCVAMASCDTQEEARLMASAWVGRGAAGYVTELEGAWRVLGAVYDGEKEAARIAGRLKDEEGIPAEAICLRAEGVTLRVTATEAQIGAISGADALLRDQTRQLGQMALQLDRGEIRPEAARTLCGVSATEAGEAAAALEAIPGAAENRVCGGLIGSLERLSGMLATVAGSETASAAALSGMLRCAQIESFAGMMGTMGE